MKRLLLCLIFSIFMSSNAFAGYTNYNYITKLHVQKSSGSPGYDHDTVMFTAGTHYDKPACSTISNEWAFSLESSYGRGMLSLLLTAKALGKKVSVKGNGECSAWADREEPYLIDIEN